jgi:hypothetical protein
MMIETLILALCMLAAQIWEFRNIKKMKQNMKKAREYAPVDVMGGMIDEDEMMRELEERLRKKYGTAY